MSGYTEKEWGKVGTPERTAVILSKPFIDCVLLGKVREVLAARNIVGGGL